MKMLLACLLALAAPSICPGQQIDPAVSGLWKTTSIESGSDDAANHLHELDNRAVFDS